LDLTGGEISWTTADGETVMMTADDLRGVIAQAAVRSNLLHTKYREKKTLVEEATTAEEVKEITW